MKATKANTGEVAMAIMNGEKLSIEQFKVAVKARMITGMNPDDDQEIALGYASWLSQYYEDDKVHGYLCGKHLTAKLEETTDKNGFTSFTMCTWGIHLDRVNPKYLTEQNVEYLAEHLGKENVEAVIGKR
jgi:hypothetical protein